VAARVLGAAALAALALYGLRAGGVSWPVSLAAGAAAAMFTLWRTVAGVCVACAMVVVAAASAVLLAGVPLRVPRGLAGLLVALELFGLGSVAVVALVREPRRVSHRLLGAWFVSSGTLLLGLALCSALPHRGTGSVLVAAGLAYRLGTVPAYAWAPLLLRHPSALVALLGVVATVAASAVLLVALPRLPDQVAAARTLAVLSAVTIPWAVWHAVRQWRRDRRCALSNAATAE